MTSLGPWFGGGGGGGGGRRTGIDQFGSAYVDPFDFFSGNLGLWDFSRRRRQGGGGGGGGGDDDTASVLAHTNVDWRETDSAHIFHADLPGVKKEEVKVHVEDGNTLQISGEHTVEEEVDTNDKWHRSERRRGSFTRRFRLPENAKMDEIKCSMEHGVLTVVVPKIEEEEKPKNVSHRYSLGLYLVHVV